MFRRSSDDEPWAAAFNCRFILSIALRPVWMGRHGWFIWLFTLCAIVAHRIMNFACCQLVYLGCMPYVFPIQNWYFTHVRVDTSLHRNHMDTLMHVRTNFPRTIEFTMFFYDCFRFSYRDWECVCVCVVPLIESLQLTINYLDLSRSMERLNWNWNRIRMRRGIINSIMNDPNMWTAITIVCRHSDGHQ